jgi:hypothetical protein
MRRDNIPAVLHVLTLLACTMTHREALRARAAEGALAEAVQDYWEGVRWSRPERALAHLSPSDASTVLATGGLRRVTDVAVLRVVVDAPATDDPLRTPRAGQTWTRVESFAPREGRVDSEVVNQAWSRGTDGVWRVDTARTPLHADRPW